MHGTALLIPAILPVILAAIFGLLNEWLKEARDRRDRDKERQRTLTEAQEVTDAMQGFAAAYKLVASTDEMSEEIKSMARSYLDQAFSQLDGFLVPQAARERITLRRLAATMLLTGRPKNRKGKIFLAAYYSSLFWALLVAIIVMDDALSPFTLANVLAAIMAMLILGILPAWGCRRLTIRAVNRRADELVISASHSEPQGLGEQLTAAGSADAIPVETGIEPLCSSPAQPSSAGATPLASLTQGTASPPRLSTTTRQPSRTYWPCGP